MRYIDAHVHVWTDDTIHYPLAEGYRREDMMPRSFTTDELFRHTRRSGVNRVNLIQISFYGFNNRYMIDMIGLHREVFVGTAVIDPLGKEPDRQMTDLAKQRVRAFRILPRLSKQLPGRWLEPEGYHAMFQAGAKHNLAMSCLIDPDGLPELDRMCRRHPDTPVIIDHLCRIGADGTIRDKDVTSLVNMARHKRVMVKVGAFYALGKRQAPYTDLESLIERVVKAFGPRRCMWESDCPFQVSNGYNYADSIDLVRTRLKFLSDDDRDWLLRRTAEEFFLAGDEVPMSVIVEFYGIPRQRAGQPEALVAGETVADVLTALERSFPGLGSLRVNGCLAPQFLLSLDGERFVADFDERVEPGSRLLLLSADAGG